MRLFHLIAGLGVAAIVSACQPLSPQDRSNIGLVAGAAGGALLARELGANDNWTILAGVAGAAAGTLLARNTQTGQCAYANGDGTYSVAPCR